MRRLKAERLQEVMEQIVGGNTEAQRGKDHPDYDQRVDLWAIHK